MAKHGGWAGKVLRIDLSTGRISTEDTVEKYKDVLGGTGLGYKVLWEEVAPGTKPFDPANKIIFGTGPLAGTGAPCNGRTAITTLWPTCWPKPLVASGHMGGQFAAELKYAGYDGIIVEGKADRPVYVSIMDKKVEIKGARHLWGQGIRRTTVELSQKFGPEVCVAAIGQAGENLIPMSVVMNAYSHSAGGVGAVLGSKNLKAIAVHGTGSVRIAGKKEEWEKLVKLHLSLLGANNQHVVPSSPQPWAEYYSPGSRWKGPRGNRWGASEPAIDTRICDPHDLNTIAYRTNNAAFYLGDIAWKYTVRGNGCTGCPIRCHTMIKVPSVAAKYGIPEVGMNTCGGLNFGRSFFSKFPDGARGMTSMEACMVGMHMSDDYGLWCNYSQLQRDFRKLYESGTIKNKLGEKEFNSYSWDKYEKGDPSFLFELVPRIALKQGELGTALGLGTGPMLETWSLSEEDWKKDYRLSYWKMGHPKHHASEEVGQCGLIINTQYNRDAQCHSHCNFTRNGLPLQVQKRLAAESLAWLAPDKNNVLQVWVKTIGKDGDKIVTADRKRGIREYFWAEDNRTLLYLQDNDGDENFHVYGVDLGSGNVRDFTPFQGVRASIVDISPVVPDEILLEMNLRNRELMDVHRLNLKTGGIVLDTENPGDVSGWNTDAKLRVHAALGRLPPHHRALLILREFEGLSYEELAGLFRCRVGTIKSGLHGARMEFKDALIAKKGKTNDAL